MNISDFYDSMQENKTYYVQFSSDYQLTLNKLIDLSSGGIIDINQQWDGSHENLNGCRYVDKAIQRCEQYLAEIFGKKTAQAYADALRPFSKYNLQYGNTSFSAYFFFGFFSQEADYTIEVPDDEIENYMKQNLNLPYVLPFHKDDKPFSPLLVGWDAYEYFYKEEDGYFNKTLPYKATPKQRYKAIRISSDVPSNEELISKELNGIYFPELNAYMSLYEIEKEHIEVTDVTNKGDDVVTEELIVPIKDFIYKVDEAKTIKIETSHNSIDEFFASEFKFNDTLTLVAIDTKSPIITLEKTEKDGKKVFKFIVDITNTDGDDFRIRTTFDTQDKFMALIQSTVNALKEFREFYKYAEELENCL